MTMLDACLDISAARQRWIDSVRKAYCAAREVDMGDEVTMPLADWERIANAILAPVLIADVKS